MDCKKAQRLFEDLSRDRLTLECAAEVRQHLADCTDCRVLEQRASRLQRVLALKRYEHPSPEYFDNFLTEFHKRLLAETQPQMGWWERTLGGIDDFLSAESMQVWRYGLASALGVTIIVGLMWTGLRETSESADVAGQVAGGSSSLIMTSRIPAAASTPTLAMASSQFPGSLHVAPVDYQLTMADLPEQLPTVTRAESSTPQYVLDRISVTPATYEVASVHF
jgi:hypothetical protein